MLHQVNIITHVIAGLVAIVFGVFAYATTKGGPRHRRSGLFFLGLMAIVILTALFGVLFFRDRPFLTVVTVQSFYFSYSGYRVLQTKNRGFQFIDFLVMILTITVGILFLIKMNKANILWNTGIVYYLLGYLFVIVIFDLLRYFRPHLIKIKNFWLYDHIYKMTGAFTALVSAGIGTVFAAWEPYNQILPAILGTLWLIFCLIYFPKSFSH